MKLSIITPTHNTEFLNELQNSIFANTHTDWEWIVLSNNGAKPKLKNDTRIRIIESKSNSSFVGALKNEACSHATGEVIVEIDHDDMITTNCLSKIAHEFQDKKIGFVYSDNAKLSDNFQPYDPFWGWEYYLHNWFGKDLIAMKSQPLTPARLGYIWYAPDHVRSWRKSVYDSIGGHNKSLEICDDLDLMHRLYMVTEFKHVQEVLYIYRITGNNTWLKNNETIQEKTREIYNQNIYSLSERYSQLLGLHKIDLCGAFNKPNGYLSIDLEDADITANLNEGIPMADDSCGIVRAYDALEHLTDKKFMMEEIYRVLAPGGILLSQTPSTDGRGAWQDPTHVSFWNENSFWYWTRPEQMKYIRNEKRFFESNLITFFPSDWHKQNNISYVQAFLEKI